MFQSSLYPRVSFPVDDLCSRHEHRIAAKRNSKRVTELPTVYFDRAPGHEAAGIGCEEQDRA